MFRKPFANVCARLGTALLFLGFVSPAGNAFALDRRNVEKQSEVLARLTDYKTWKRVNRLDGDGTTGAFKIESSTFFG